MPEPNPIHRAVLTALARIDHFLGGSALDSLPPAPLRHAAHTLLGQSASVRTAGLFLSFYSLYVPAYDFASVPAGWRGTRGDRLLGEELRARSLSLGNVKAFAENIGSKGAQGDFDPSVDSRFLPFAALMAEASLDDRRRTADYLASRYAGSQQRLASLPEVGDDVLTFVRAKDLFRRLLSAPSGGVFPQFLVAALLRQSRAGTGIDVTTHNPYGSDRSDRTAGDVEERVRGRLLRAYEVTANRPWRDRLSAAQRKMDRHGLAKYVILARHVNADPEWSEPAALALNLDDYRRDIAVVDLDDLTSWMAAELSSEALRAALQRRADDPLASALRSPQRRRPVLRDGRRMAGRRGDLSLPPL